MLLSSKTLHIIVKHWSCVYQQHGLSDYLYVLLGKDTQDTVGRKKNQYIHVYKYIYNNY